MSSFSSLPVELQQQCAGYLDLGTLKNLRLASRQTALNIGPGALFETVVLRFNATSAERITNVLGNTKLKALVRRIVIDGRDGTWHEEDPTDEDYERTPWALVVTKISEFPSVKDVEFWFDDEVEADDWLADGNLNQSEGYRGYYQELFYQSLEDTGGIEGLTVKNAQDSLIGHTGEGDGFKKALKRLALLIRTETTAAPETDHEQPSFQQCFNSELIRHWLVPTQSQLTSLTIYCDYQWNPNPFCDLSKLQFPHLVELAFGNWPIAFDWQVDWIVSHGGTLEKLSLTGCPIIYLVSGGDFSSNWPKTESVFTSSILTLYSTRWSDVFPLFQQNLPRLTCFDFKPCAPYNVELYFDKRFVGVAQIKDPGYSLHNYITYQGGTGPSPYTDDLYDFRPPDDSNFEGLIWEDGDDRIEFFPPEDLQRELDGKAFSQLLGIIESNRKHIQQAKRENV